MKGGSVMRLNMGIAVCLAASLMAVDARGDGFDYGALLAELQSLKDDSDVKSYLASDLRLANLLLRSEQAMDADLRAARQRHAMAKNARQSKAAAMLAQLTGDRVLAQSGQQLQSGLSAEELESQADSYTESALSTLVDLVYVYRDIKGSAVNQQQEGARKGSAGKHRPATSKSSAIAQSESAGGSRRYTIEAAVNDETFVINDNVYKARTYCFNVAKGDRVIFVDGSAWGACVSAEFVNLRTGDKCAVWCE
jgi:hypothetical protein